MTNINDFTHRFIPAEQDGAITLLLLHGTGGNENDLLNLGRTLAADAALLSPRGKVLEHGMPRFFRRLAEGVFDLEDLRFRTNELADWIEQAIEHYKLDHQKLIAVGYSNGANIAASMLLLRPGVLTGVVLLRAMVPLEPESTPDLHGTRVLMRAGRFDQMISPESGERLARMLEQAGADVTFQWHPGSHGLTMEDVQAAQGWLIEKIQDKTTES